MKEPVEDKLIDKIRQVFDEFEDNSADSGWKKFREQYPEQPAEPTTTQPVIKPLVTWLSSAAAILLIVSVRFISIKMFGFFLNNSQ